MTYDKIRDEMIRLSLNVEHGVHTQIAKALNISYKHSADLRNNTKKVHVDNSRAGLALITEMRDRYKKALTEQRNKV